MFSRLQLKHVLKTFCIKLFTHVFTLISLLQQNLYELLIKYLPSTVLKSVHDYLDY